LSTTEWCHCQRDTWMLVPALLALNLRARQAKRLRPPGASRARLAIWALVEGMLWATACWIKPFVAVPCGACSLVAARQVWLAAGRSVGKLALDATALLAGGIVIGGAGVAWLVGTGAWPAFYEVIFVWNGEYFTYNTYGDQRWLKVAGFLIRFFPWVLIHLAAVPVAVGALARLGRQAHRPGESGAAAEPSVPPMLAAFYLA